MQSSQNLEWDMIGVIDRLLWSANLLLLADHCDLPIRDYWQTVHRICECSANLLLLADPNAICKSLTKYCFAIYWANYVNSSSNLVFIFVTDTVFSIVKSYSFTVTLTECLKGLNLRLSLQDCFGGVFSKSSCCCPFVRKLMSYHQF